MGSHSSKASTLQKGSNKPQHADGVKSYQQPGTAQSQKHVEPQEEKNIPWFELLSQVAKEELWGGISREERPEWKIYLQQAEQMAKKDLDIPEDATRAILLGDMNQTYSISNRTKILVFISSTFTDTQAERDILMKDVYPFVRTVCQAIGLDFGTVDMRWGVTEEASNDHSVIELCEDELQRCLKTSCGPAFLGIVSHKYGYRMLPAQIEKTEFETLMAYLINNNKETETVKMLYRLDKNFVEPEYVLVPISSMDKDTWWTSAEKVVDQLREAASECFGKDAENVKKYFVSVTETEIQSGVFKNPKKDDQVIIVQRELADLMSESNKMRKILDVKDGKVDEYAQEKLKDLKERLRQSCNNIKTFSYKEATIQSCKNSVRNICDHVCKILLDKIFDNFSKFSWLKSDTLLEEICQHRIQAVEKRALFVGKENELQVIQSYLQSDSSSPLVIHGLSGCGKTTLMAVAASKAIKHVPGCALVLRFLGTTPNTGSVRSMLLSICEQISRIYQKPMPDLPNTGRELEKYVRQCLGYANKKLPLVLFLDSLDQLSDTNSNLSVGWMVSGDKLPEHVKLVVSALPSPVLTRLQGKLGNDMFIRVNILLPAEGPHILSKMLASKGKKVNEDQQRIIMATFMGCPLPLYLRLAADLALRWHSYNVITHQSVAQDVSGMITGIFEQLENKYGKVFVHHALAYLSAAKAGLSETELEDILSCDDEVLDILFKWWQPPMRCLPKLLWARVRTDLGAYLVERGSEETTVYRWYHRQFWETATKRYLDEPFGSDSKPFREKAHAAIADYFDNKWADGKMYPDEKSSKKKKMTPKLEPRGIQKQLFKWGSHGIGVQKWNKRKLYELPYHIMKIEDWNRLLDLVSELQYIEGKFAVGYGHDYYRELTDAFKCSGKNEFHPHMTRFVGSNLAFLQSEPSSVYQLASQQAIPLLTNKLNALGKAQLPFTLMQGDQESGEDHCELTLQGHTKGVYSCDFSRKGDLIVSTSEDGTLCVWDAVTGEVTATVTSLPTEIGQDMVDGLRMITHHVNPCCFSPTDDVIAVGTESGEIMLLDVTGEQLKVEYTDQVKVTSVKFCPTHSVLATSFKSGKVYIWNATTLEHLHTVQFDRPATDLDFSPDGSLLAVSCTSDIPTVLVGWGIDFNHCSSVQSGLALVNTKSYTIESYTVDQAYATAKHHRRARFHMVFCCSFHPKGKLVMTGAADSHIAVWEAKTGECIDKIQGHDAWIWSIQFTQDGQYMFTASSDRSVMVWYAKGKTWDCVTSLYGHSHRITMMRLDPSSESVLVTASLDSTLKVWDISTATKTKQQSKTVTDEIGDVKPLLYNTLAISPQGNRLMISQGWDTACALLTIGDENSKYASTPRHAKGYIRKADFVTDGSRVVVLDHGHGGDFVAGAAAKALLIVSSATDGSELKNLDVNYEDGKDETEDGPTAFGLSQNFIVVGTMNGVVIVYDINSYEKVKSWQIEDEVSTVSCSIKDDHVITTAGSEVTLWRVSPTEIQCIKGPLSVCNSKIVTSAFSPLGNMFAVGHQSGQAGVWRIAEEVELARSIAAHKSEVSDLRFSGAGLFIATCGNHRVRVWSTLGEIELKSSYFAPVVCLAFKEENVLLAGDATGKLHKLTFL